MNEFLAFVIGLAIAAIILSLIIKFINFFRGGITQIQSGGSGNIQIQSGRSSNVSIANLNGHVKIKGNVRSVTINGKKVYE